MFRSRFYGLANGGVACGGGGGGCVLAGRHSSSPTSPSTIRIHPMNGHSRIDIQRNGKSGNVGNILCSVRCFSSTRCSLRSATSDTAAEDSDINEEDDAAIEEEKEDIRMLPLAFRLSKQADSLDKELERIAYVLFEKPQLLFDNTAAPFTRRPASCLRYLSHAKQSGKASSTAADSSSVSLPSHPVLFGSASFIIRRYAELSSLVGFLPSSQTAKERLRRDRKTQAGGSGEGDSAMVTLEADKDTIRRLKRLHPLGYYRRMNFVPKRNAWHATYEIVWNMWLGCVNATCALVYGPIRGFCRRGAMVAAPSSKDDQQPQADRTQGGGILRGTLHGVSTAASYLFLGFVVSPLVHIPCGLANSVIGAASAVSGRYYYDADCGRWMRCTVADARALENYLNLERRTLRAIGMMEFKRLRMLPAEAWKRRLESMGFSLDQLKDNFERKLHEKVGGKSRKNDASNGENPYEVLQVRRTVTKQQLKAQYKKLASVYHPDVVQGTRGGNITQKEKEEAQLKFESISNAYQILSNPEKKRAYDAGGTQALHLHETKMGKFMSGTVEEMMQSVFGGKPFQELLIGDLLRSHWHLRNEAQTNVSLHSFEVLQTIRCRKVAIAMAKIVDVHAKKPRHTAGSAGIHGHGTSKMSMTSSLPDPLHGSAVRRKGMTTPGASPNRTTELENALKSELGTDDTGTPKPTTSKFRGGSSYRPRSGQSASHDPLFGGKSSTPSVDSSQAAEQTVQSPYELVLGSNEFNDFSPDFVDRCDRLVKRLSEACFGPEMLNEIGIAYIVSSQRFLGVLPFYAPKVHCWKKVFSGTDRVFKAFSQKSVGKGDKEKLAKMILMEYFSMEFDSVICDFNIIIRYAAQMVLKDETEPEDVLKRRAYALWLLGTKMKQHGRQWDSDDRDDAELMAYVQQAANSSRTTGPPPPF